MPFKLFGTLEMTSCIVIELGLMNASGSGGRSGWESGQEPPAFFLALLPLRVKVTRRSVADSHCGTGCVLGIHWLSEHRNSFPPTVLHLTDGESTDGDPTDIGREILSRRTSDGDALVFNCHVSSRHSVKIEYPSDESRLPDDFAKMLFNMSSRLPEPFRRASAEIGITMGEGARGFVFNGDPVSVAQFFDIGTRPANLR